MPFYPIDGSGRRLPATAVAIDDDKSSPQAVKWAVDHLLHSQDVLVLLHVKTKTASTSCRYSLFGSSGSSHINSSRLVLHGGLILETN